MIPRSENTRTRLAHQFGAGLTVLMTVAAIALSAAWIRSYFAKDSVAWARYAESGEAVQQKCWAASSVGGGLALDVTRYALTREAANHWVEQGLGPGLYYFTGVPDGYPQPDRATRRVIGAAGLYFETASRDPRGDRRGQDFDVHRVTVPHAVPFAAFASLPIIRLLATVRRRRRARTGRCPACGYDLRGTPAADRCPECGTPVEVLPSTTPPG